jgi:uncharacterized protein YjbJ (UPF0337 family)
MNKDQVKGTLKKVAGQVQEKAGQMVGNPVQAAKGQAKQIEGAVQKGVGDVKEIVKDATRK